MSRDVFVSAAQSLIGIRGDALADALLPTASPEVRAVVERLSTCELTAAASLRAALRALGATVPDPDPFILGGDHAARALYALASPGGGTPWAPREGLRKATSETPPGVGDGIWFGEVKGHDGKTLHPEHTDACVTSGPENFAATPGSNRALRYRVIAGGQPDGSGHSSAIAEVDRILVWNGNEWVCQRTNRPVWCVIDAYAVAECYGIA